MKKILLSLLALSVMLASFSACGNKNSMEDSKKEINYSTNGKENKLVANESATGELNIAYFGTDFDKEYNSDMGDPLNAAKKMFHELYPNIVLNIDRVSYTIENYAEDTEAYSKKLATEVMSGSGPDLFWLQYYMDTPKMMNAGAFADLYPYFEQDPNFNITDYNSKVFSSGQTEGKQYVIPLYYTVPFLVSTKSAVEAASFDVSKCTDFTSCWEEIISLYERSPERPPSTDVIRWFTSPYRFPGEAGLNWIDFENQAMLLETPQMKQALETYKAFYSFEKKAQYSSSDHLIGNAVKAKACVFAETELFNDVILNSRHIASFDEPVIVPIRTVDGTIEATNIESVAVSNGSTNIQNAYYFIKVLLSQEMQKRALYLCNYIPISNAATKAMLQNCAVEEEYHTEAKIEKLSPLSQDFIDEFMGYLNEIDRVYYARIAGDMLREEMMPYFNDKKSYEECLANAQSKLEIYVSE